MYIYFPKYSNVFFRMCLIIHNILASSFVEERQQSICPKFYSVFIWRQIVNIIIGFYFGILLFVVFISNMYRLCFLI